MSINILVLGKFEWNCRLVILRLSFVIDDWGMAWEITLWWLILDLTDDRSTLVQVMAWCRQAASHYLSQCWPRCMPPYSITRPQWVNDITISEQSSALTIQRTRYIFYWRHNTCSSHSYLLQVTLSNWTLNRFLTKACQFWQVYLEHKWLCSMNRTYPSGGHYWDYYTGTHSLSQVIATDW